MTKIVEPEEYFRRAVHRGRPARPIRNLSMACAALRLVDRALQAIVTERLHNRGLTTYGCSLMVE
jgi:hypothetical protein